LPPAPTADAVARVRRFNRSYTRRIGLLEQGLLHSPFSLAEVRVLYEIAHRTDPTASALLAELGLDRGYLSRILQRLRKSGLVSATTAPGDRRRRLLALTPRGRRTFGALEARSSREVGLLLGRLTPSGRRRFTGAMATIESLLAGADEGARTGRDWSLRGPAPGDFGWVVQRHGELYAAEFDWNEEFEGLVAGIVARFVEHFDPERERCWIAEVDGMRAGSVFLVRESDTVARLRLLLVEPWARGHGLGHALVDACVRFAGKAGYRTITLWTQSVLRAAGRIYQEAGFRLVREGRHRSFGADLVEQVWEKTL